MGHSDEITNYSVTLYISSDAPSKLSTVIGFKTRLVFTNRLWYMWNSANFLGFMHELVGLWTEKKRLKMLVEISYLYQLNKCVHWIWGMGKIWKKNNGFPHGINMRRKTYLRIKIIWQSHFVIFFYMSLLWIMLGGLLDWKFLKIWEI